MIIFYNKSSGDIVGTIGGRVHSPAHMKMWIGDENETDRLVFEWVLDADNKYIPDFEQTDLLSQVEKNGSVLKQYKVDIETKLLVKI